MVTSGGGWTVIQRRMDGSVDFYRGWEEYKRGFGNKEGEFWLGLDNIHSMTSTRRYRVRFDMEDFEGNTCYAEYDDFRVDDEAAKYRLAALGIFSGDAGNSFNSLVGQPFSTKDHDNDNRNFNCAQECQGGWWYKKCHNCNPNGLYLKGQYSLLARDGQGIVWKTWLGINYSLKRMEIKLRPY
ncbi:ficolin-1 [Nematostella vectensis]|uniref:ficolin-1 n=1 Tax=Nematostella vectensis TaxID=45351 RepID=UPI002077606C|nr:ficolin-1 [Nematostella vectensis]